MELALIIVLAFAAWFYGTVIYRLAQKLEGNPPAPFIEWVLLGTLFVVIGWFVVPLYDLHNYIKARRARR